MSGGGGYGRRVRLHPTRRDAEAMTRRPWLAAHEAGRLGAMDAKRISSYVYAQALAGENVTEMEIALLLSRSRDYVTAKGGPDAGTRPTTDERERARFALQELVKRNKQLRKYVVLDGGDDDAEA